MGKTMPTNKAIPPKTELSHIKIVYFPIFVLQEQLHILYLFNNIKLYLSHRLRPTH